MSCVIMTNHGTKRSKERIGLPKRALERNAEKAYENGLTQSDLSGSLKRYMSKLFFNNQTAGNIRVYCGNVYIFSANRLVTVLELPERFKKIASNIAMQKKKENKN